MSAAGGAAPRRGPAGRLASFFVGSKLTPLLVVAALGLGVVAVLSTPREEEPQIVVPIVDVFVGLPGAAPAEVETRLTLPLEKRLAEIAGVEHVYSTSLPEGAMVTARFRVGDDQSESLVAVFEKLASGLGEMPPQATPPLVKERAIDDVPVLAFTLWSERYDGPALRRVAVELARETRAVPGVAEVTVTGGEPRQVRVLLEPTRMASAGVDPAAVRGALAAQNATLGAGTLADAGREVLVEAGAFLREADEVAALVVGVHGGRPVRLRDVARVVDGPAEATSHVFFRSGAAADADAPRTEGLRPAVTVAIAKRHGADAERVVTAIEERIAAVRGRLLPADVHVATTRDYGATASQKAEELLLHLGLAVVSVTLVIGLALGWRGALVVFVSVPVSFALTLFVYSVFGYTLNRVTLFALVFVTGIVVDDSIIVVENVVRHLREKRAAGGGAGLVATVIDAVDEVGNPTILATLTVIVSVLPMAFVRGLMGPYMRPMPIGASLAMAFSLLVALVAAPWLAARVLKSHRLRPHAGAGDVADELEEARRAHGTRLYRVYRATLQPLLADRRKAWAVLAAVTVALVASVALVPLRGVAVKMLPFDDKSELTVVLDLPEGTTLEATSRAAREVADRLAAAPEVRDLQIYAGVAAPIDFNGLVRHYDLRRGPTVADVRVRLLDKDERAAQSHAIAERLRPWVEEVATRHGAAAKVVEVPPGPPVLSTLVAEVYGPDEAERLRVAAEVRRIFAETPGVVDVDWLVEAPQPKLVFDVDREKAALHGVAAAEVARTLRLAVGGEDAGLLHDPDELEPVALRLELPRAERSSVARLGELRLAGAGGAMVPLGELVTVRETVREPSRHRKDLQPVVYVTGDVAGEAASPVYALLAMRERLAAIETSGGARLEQVWGTAPVTGERTVLDWDGEWHVTHEVFRDLGLAFAVVLLAMYLLLVGWFGSFRVPAVMMLAIPLGLVGVLPGHWLFGAYFTATSMIGFIALAGIMVRNSVLLIDFVDLAMSRGRCLAEAVIDAGSIRFRPILLTAGTVVVGALPILFDPIFQGLAIALMAGALASTALTLVVVPLVYFLTEHRRHPDPIPASWTAELCDLPAPAAPELALQPPSK